MAPEAILEQEFELARNNARLVVLEGFHAVKHGLRFGAILDRIVIIDEGPALALAESLAPDIVEVLTQRSLSVPRSIFTMVAPKAVRTGVVGIARRPSYELAEVLERPGAVAFLEDPRNLGNVGASIRVAAAARFAAVLTSGEVDPWHPEAVRGSAGLHFAVPVFQVDEVALLARADRILVALDPAGEELDTADVSISSIFAFGSERYGLSSHLRNASDRVVRLPMRAGVSSLNLATTVAAVAYGIPSLRKYIDSSAVTEQVTSQRAER